MQLFSAYERLESGKFSKWSGNFHCSFRNGKRGLPSVGSIKFVNRFSGKLGCLPFSKIIRKFRLKVKWNKNFCGKSDQRFRVPPEVNLVFRSERNGKMSLPFCKLSSFQSLISRQQFRKSNFK